MKKKISLYRVVLNMIFYVFYVLLVSIVFSFIFPTIMVALWKVPLEQNNPLFPKIQIAIIVLVLVFTIILRKFLYLPIFTTIENIEEKNIKSEANDSFGNNTSKFEEIETEKFNTFDTNTTVKEKETLVNFPNLDIKIGKEIK